MRLYHIISVRTDNGERRQVTTYPMNRTACCTMMSKFTAHGFRTLILEEVKQLNPLQTMIINTYLDYVNNFLTIGAFACHYGISIEMANVIIKEGRELNNTYLIEETSINMDMATGIINQEVKQ